LADITITLGRDRAKIGSIAIRDFSRALPQNIQAAMRFAGATLERQIYKNLTKYKGPRKRKGKTIGGEPPQSREFPAFRSGHLAKSVTFRLVNQNRGVRIGPGGFASAYAGVQEFGSAAKNIPARPYVRPAWKKQKNAVINGIKKRLFKPLEKFP